MQIINHGKRPINYSIKQSNSRINVGEQREGWGAHSRMKDSVRERDRERERETVGNIKEYGITPLSLSCGPSHTKLSKTTADPAFHLPKFKGDFGNTSFSLQNSLGLCSSLVRLLFSVSVYVATPFLYYSFLLFFEVVVTTPKTPCVRLF